MNNDKKNSLFNCCFINSNDIVILEIIKQKLKEKIFLIFKISVKIKISI